VLDQHPMLFLSVFLIIFWLITTWSFAQCERFGRKDEDPFLLYTNALWFIAITFNVPLFSNWIIYINCLL
jgi:hypothetical protein